MMNPELSFFIAVDFDGTICKDAFPDIGEPHWNIIYMLRGMYEDRKRICIHTCRVNSHWGETIRKNQAEEMISWLKEHEVPYDYIWNYPQYDKGKPMANYYLDNKSIFVGPEEEWSISEEGEVKVNG